MIPESKPQSNGFWSNGRGKRFSDWLDSWARWPDVIGIIIWASLVYLAAHFAYSSSIEGATLAETYAVSFTVILFVLGLAIRFSYYRFVQKRKMK